MVTTEVAMCTFCGRPRTLRKEEHQLGALVRTLVTCETCHRTLSSSIGVAAAEAAEATDSAAPVEEPAAESSPVKEKAAPAKPAARPKAKAASKPKATSPKPKAPTKRSRPKG